MSTAELALTAQVTQEEDDEPGSLADLPVRFTIRSIHMDGTASEVTNVEYVTNETGNVSASISIPAGLYEIKAGLLPNSYYKTAQTTVVAAVYEPGTGMRMNGWLAIPPGSGELGDKAKKLMIETEWQTARMVRCRAN